MYWFHFVQSFPSMTWTKERGAARVAIPTTSTSNMKTTITTEYFISVFHTSHLERARTHHAVRRYLMLTSNIQQTNKVSDFVGKWTVGSGAPSSLYSAHRRPLKLPQRGSINNYVSSTFSTRAGVTQSTTPPKSAPIGAFWSPPPPRHASQQRQPSACADYL